MEHKQSHELAWADRPLRELLRLAWPMVVQLLSLSLMTFVDTLFIGWLGWIELAAAGLGGMCTFTVLSFGMSVFSAARVEVGTLHGRGDVPRVNSSLGAFLRLSLALGLLSLALGWLTATVLPFLAGDPQTGALAARYALIRSLAFPIILIGTAIGQWLAAQGDSRSAMRAALIANLANIPLNAALIFGLGWGVEGAAVASALSGCFETIYLVRLQSTRAIDLEGARSTTPGFHLALSNWRASSEAFVRGLPTGLERVLDMMAFTAVPVLLAQVGPVHVAAHQVVLQLLLIAFLPSIALSDSVSVLVSQAVGAQSMFLVRRLSRLGLVVGAVYSLVCSVLYLGAGTQLLGIFSKDQVLVQAALPALALGALLQMLNSAYNHYKGILRGLSVFRYVAWVTVGCAWLATPPLTYLWSVREGRGVTGAWMALCAEVTVGLLLMFLRARKEQAANLVATDSTIAVA